MVEVETPSTPTVHYAIDSFKSGMVGRGVVSKKQLSQAKNATKEKKKLWVFLKSGFLG